MRSLILFFSIMIMASYNCFAYDEFVDPNPSANNRFGANTIVLANGNVVITSHFANLNGKTACGAVYLFDGATGALISTLYGTSNNDGIGSGGVTALPDGNFVVNSPNWDNGAVANVGAVTWGNGTTGVSGVVSSANSLVGSTANDQVGFADDYDGLDITILSNGNYVVRTRYWDNGANSDAGAVTWGNSSTGVSGVVSSANSLVGSSANDQVGLDAIAILTNGNYVVCSSYWTNGLLAYAGAVTWCDGSTGRTGAVSTSNSLYGTQEYDYVGTSGVVALSNGNYVVLSTSWANGAAYEAGAVTWCNGSTGRTGAVSTSNSLYGTQESDQIGNNGVNALTNGNYVVVSDNWSNGSLVSAGAVTWCDGTSGRTGAVSTANSLYGSQAEDQVGRGGVVALPNGHYLIRSYRWANGAVLEAGAVTWCNGTTGRTGAVSTANSLYGTQLEDNVGSETIIVLSNGNYVVRNGNWDNGAIYNAGAVTWCNGLTGLVGAVSSANSLVGIGTSQQVGWHQVAALTNGNYVVPCPYWVNGATSAVGAVVWCNGSTGTVGSVSLANSLVGSIANDRVGNGGITALTNGNYVVGSYNWDNGTAIDAGAVTWCNGTTGTVGTVSSANSLVGSKNIDNVGSNNSITALTNGNYVAVSTLWDNNTIIDAGAATWCNGTSGTVGIISATNSLIGSAADDKIGWGGVTILPNGNYVVKSSNWANGAVTYAGAFTWGNGSDGSVVGTVTSTNSIVSSINYSALRANVINLTTSEFYSIFTPTSAQGRVYRDGSFNGFTFASSVATTAISAVTSTSASTGGTITNQEESPITVSGIVYGTTTNPVLLGDGVTDLPTSPLVESGAFISNIVGLSTNTRYYVRSYITNGTGDTYGDERNFYTLAIVPSAPTVSNPSPTSLSVAINVNGNPANTEFAIQETGGSYVQANGALGGGVVWQTAATWGTKTVTGLSNATNYTFQVKARNGDNVETNFSTTASRYTFSSEPANHVTDLDFTNPTTINSVTINWIDATDTPAPTAYLVKASVVGYNDISAPVDGTTEIDATLVQNVAFGTQTVTFTGLDNNTTYYFKIYPYRGTAETINFKTDGSVPPLNCKTQIAYPSEQATDIGFARITRSSMNVYWTRGDGDASILLGREKYRINSTPLTDGVVYTANTDYDLAPSVSGAKVLSNGTDRYVTITGLSRYMLVYFKVCEYNDPSVGSPLYLQEENASNPRARWTLRRDAMMEEDLTIDAEFAYPNPAKNSISTNFDLFEAGKVSAKLYDIEGREVIDLYSQELEFGYHTLTFDISKVQNGVYQLVISKGNEVIAYPVAVAK